MKTTKIDLTGKRSGKLIAVSDVGRDTRSNRVWECRCDCGETCLVPATRLLKQSVYSCGCTQQPRSGRPVKHGLIGTPMYNTWQGMVQRCTNPNHDDFDSYGGRGIVICERWRDFRNFYADMGDRPEGRTLDRIDVNGNYEPSNCRWATAQEQRTNRRA